MSKSSKIAFIIGGIILVLLIAIPQILGGLWGGQSYGYGMMGGFGGMWLMPVFGLVFLGLIIWGIVALARGATSTSNVRPADQTSSPLEILKRRYASGEINKQEFEEKKKDLI